MEVQQVNLLGNQGTTRVDCILTQRLQYMVRFQLPISIGTTQDTPKGHPT